MLRYLQERLGQGDQFPVDVVLKSGLLLERVEVVEADEFGLLTLRQACHRLIPWTSISYLIIEEVKNGDAD